MNTTTKVIISGLVAVIVVMYGFLLLRPTTTFQLGGATLAPAGTTNSTQNIAQATITTGVATSTYASFYNSSADRVIETVYYNLCSTCGTTGTTTPILYVGTSTNPTAFTDVNGALSITSANFILASTISTGTPYFSTSTSAFMNASNPAIRIWPSGTYLNVIATSSTITGIVGVRYWQD
jgi:hypothetical protein